MVVKANVDWETDPVVAPALSPEEWLETRKQAAAAKRHNSVVVWCCDCGGPMHPKELSGTRTRFFAHHPTEQGKMRDCALAAGESPSHVRHKTSIYKAISKVAGWRPDVEVRTEGSVDERTGKPVVIDVVARRDGAAGTRPYGRLGWEVQLSHMDTGEALNRQHLREEWCRRCMWVSEKQFKWSEFLPWYQVSTVEDGAGAMVVGGVLTKYHHGGGRGIEMVRAEPFSADLMVQMILRSQINWQDADGAFVLNDTEEESKKRKRPPVDNKRSPRGNTAEHCYRPALLPPSLPAARERDLDYLGDHCSICGVFVLHWHMDCHRNVCERTWKVLHGPHPNN